MKHYLIIAILLLNSLNNFGQTTSSPTNSNNKSASTKKSKLTYKIIEATDKTFCYDIFADNKIIIHQPSIPGIPGNKGFETKADAEKVAKLVISKMKKGEIPPTVTVDEMKKLNVIK